MGFKEGELEGQTLKNQKVLPSFFWTLSDFSMSFKSLTPLSYLMNYLEEQKEEDALNALKKEVKTLFSDLQVFTLPPAASPDFAQAMQKYRERLLVYGSNFK